MAHRFRLVEQFDLNDRLESVRAPALVLAGDRDMLVSPTNLRALCSGIPNARFVSLPRCGHLAFVTQAEKVAGEVSAFLNDVREERAFSVGRD
jgi:pimeloyl-ACP methyl ester carboxylesterase